jgi:hypothetical protein
MSNKLLYLFGAGASVNAFPLAKDVYVNEDIIIKGLPRELIEFNFDHYLSELKNEENRKFVDEMKIKFKNIGNQAFKFGDVDTYAKYLNLKNPGGREIKSLKEMLSAFFVLKQKFENKKDDRYLSWLVSIMNRNKFPENVKMLSWNYDYQMQIAASEFGPFENIDHSINSYAYYPAFIGHYPNLESRIDEKYNSYYQLNGTAGYTVNINKKTTSIYNELLSNSNDDLIEFMRNNYMHNSIHFVWENTNYHKEILEKIKPILNEVTIFVIIGYSFPFFNREVDKSIFEELKNLKKIYYQNPTMNGQQLKNQFNLDNSIDIKHIQQTDNFHIPFEY